MSKGDNIQGILDTIGPFWAKWGLGRFPRSVFFLCGNPEDLSATLQQPIFTKFGHKMSIGVPSWNLERHFKTFHFRGHLPPKSEIKNRSNRHFTQSRLQVMGCTSERYCLLHVVVQGPGSFRDRSTFLFCMTYSYGVIGCQSFPIFGFWLIFHLQNP